MGKREDILDATLELVMVDGLESVTFAKIFKKANVGSGTLYNYFSSKDELINELYVNTRTKMGEATVTDYDSSTALYSRFKCIIQNMLCYAVKFPKEFLFIDTYSYSSSIAKDVILQDYFDMNKNFLDIINDGQSQGVIRDIDLYLSIQVVFGIVSSVVKGYFSGKYPLNELQIQQTIESCWRAIRI